ncbi:hypothetical protein EJ06DRAFT_554844 [Trichodelitschia bisporula]|uniref:Uncharacterized protein n=1 Tax=Trichodelitschia bisporula TaxID=703511 RepID=A0A6G1I1T9_9PEZI|nr:hypothetical protein EJ06DRAFT_554844 [Trichodelitschia bisporula]
MCKIHIEDYTDCGHFRIDHIQECAEPPSRGHLVVIQSSGLREGVCRGCFTRGRAMYEMLREYELDRILGFPGPAPPSRFTHGHSAHPFEPPAPRGFSRHTHGGSSRLSDLSHTNPDNDDTFLFEYVRQHPDDIEMVEELLHQMRNDLNARLHRGPNSYAGPSGSSASQTRGHASRSSSQACGHSSRSSRAAYPHAGSSATSASRGGSAPAQAGTRANATRANATRANATRAYTPSQHDIQTLLDRLSNGARHRSDESGPSYAPSGNTQAQGHATTETAPANGPAQTATGDAPHATEADTDSPTNATEGSHTEADSHSDTEASPPKEQEKLPPFVGH